MKIWKSATEVEPDWLPTVVAIGKFDGVHLGHQALLRELVDSADDQSLTPAVLTFDRNPLAVIAPERCPVSILGPNQRAELIADFGAAAMLELAFDRQLAELPAEAFIQRILIEAIDAKTVVVGEGFRFGAGGSGDVELLRVQGSVHGFRVRVVPAVQLSGERVSSSRIRQLLATGDVAEAAKLLGRNHQTRGLVEHGRKLGRTIGFPTANLARSAEGMLPADGVYAGWLTVDGERYPAAHSVGTNDSVGEVPRLVESHVIGRTDLDLYDRVATVEYLERVRGWDKFESMEALVKQIAADVESARLVLQRHQSQGAQT